MTNNGTLLEKNVFLSSGVLGILVINGNFTQGFGGTLNMLIGGTTAGTGYDQLQISGPRPAEQWAVVRATADDGLVVMMATDEEGEPPYVPARDLVFAALAAEPAEQDDSAAVAWDDGSTWEDILTLPMRLPLAIVERLAAVVALA